MRDPVFSPFRAALRPDPAEPDAFTAPRPRGSRRPHADAKVAGVRRLIEQTTLTYGEIAARTGVGRASICRWTRDGAWKRPLFAPRPTDTVPRWRASMHLKRRTLAARLAALAERHIAELEAAACVDPEKLGQALELLRIAKVAAHHRKRRRTEDGFLGEPLRPIIELCLANVDLERAPRAALADFLENRAPPPDGEKPPRGLPMPQKGQQRRKSRFDSEEYQRWMSSACFTISALVLRSGVAGTLTSLARTDALS